MELAQTIQVERYYQMPIAQVWEIITNQKYITQWLMPGNFKPEVGHHYTFQCVPADDTWDGKVSGEILAVDEPHKIVFTWNNTRLIKSTTVTFSLTETDKGVCFKVDHESFAKQDVSEHEQHTAGWSRHLEMILTEIAYEAS